MKGLSLSDLMHMKAIFERKLAEKEALMNAQRGHDYGEWVKINLEYSQDPHHEKLRKVNEMIDKIVNSI